MTKALAALFLLTAAVAAPATHPREVVQSAVSRVISVLDDADLARDEPAKAARVTPDRVRGEIRKIADALFDFREMARRTLSRHWAGRSAAEQTEFVALFRDLLERSYVGKIEAYAGEKIAYLGEFLDGNYAVVKSRIITRRRADVALDYRLVLRDGHWKVYDLLIDGVSFVSTYRSEFNRVISTSSYEGLIDAMRNKRLEIKTVDRRS